MNKFQIKYYSFGIEKEGDNMSLWCNLLDMWAQDIDENEKNNFCPYHGVQSCRGCEEAEDVGNTEEDFEDDEEK
jgi:hypothetical protein